MNLCHRRAIMRIVLTGGAALAPAVASAANDYSPAEQALFMDNHLAMIKPPLVLHYGYRKSGSLEAPFDDSVDVNLTAQPDGRCCSATTRFLGGSRATPQPTLDGLQGNPAILYFLERDIHEMQRLTKGQPSYFRNRIRMAIYQGASIHETTLPYRGRAVAVREITVLPYLDDPMHMRFEKFTNKQYVFLLSPDVPGGVYGIYTRIAGATPDAQPLIDEQMLLDGAEPLP